MPTSAGGSGFEVFFFFLGRGGGGAFEALKGF